MAVSRKIGDILKETFGSPLSDSTVVETTAGRIVLRRGGDYHEMDLSGLDLTGVDLEGANLSGAKLNGTNLSRANLTRARLDGASLSGAIISGATITGVMCDPSTFKNVRYEVEPVGQPATRHSSTNGEEEGGGA